jgi:hypothetical protein
MHRRKAMMEVKPGASLFCAVQISATNYFGFVKVS